MDSDLDEFRKFESDSKKLKKEKIKKKFMQRQTNAFQKFQNLQKKITQIQWNCNVKMMSHCFLIVLPLLFAFLCLSLYM